MWNEEEEQCERARSRPPNTVRFAGHHSSPFLLQRQRRPQSPSHRHSRSLDSSLICPCQVSLSLSLLHQTRFLLKSKVPLLVIFRTDFNVFARVGFLRSTEVAKRTTQIQLNPFLFLSFPKLFVMNRPPRSTHEFPVREQF